MKNYTITVNGNVYDVTVEEKGAGAAPAAPKAPAAPAPKAAPAPAAPKAAGAGQQRRYTRSRQQWDRACRRETLS